jgi:hypothetical protein
MPDVRKGQAPPDLDRDAFRDRFNASFRDPAFAVEQDAIARLETIAWHAYRDGRKAPLTHAAGPGFADPGYKLSDEWRATMARATLRTSCCRPVSRSVEAVAELRAGRLSRPGAELRTPRPK